MRTVKLAVAVVLLCVMSSLVAAGQDQKPAEKEPFVTGNLQVSVKSAYLAQVGVMMCDDAFLETDLKLTLGGTGFYIELWSGVPFEEQKLAEEPKKAEPALPQLEIKDPVLLATKDLLDKTANLIKLFQKKPPAPIPFEGEVDFGLGYQLKLGEYWNVDAELLYYDFNRVSHMADDQWAVQLIASYDKWRIKPWAELLYLGKMSSTSPGGGLTAMLGADYGIELVPNATLNLGTSLAFTDGGVQCTDAGPLYWRAKLGLDLKATENLCLSPSVMYQRRFAEGEFCDKNVWVFGFGGNYKFNF